MDDRELEQAVAAADPRATEHAAAPDPAVIAAMIAAASDAQAAERSRPRRGFVRGAAPMVAVALIAGSGSAAAVAAFQPSSPDYGVVLQPISFITEAGERVECTLTLHQQDVDGRPVAGLSRSFAAADLDGWGQRIYDLSVDTEMPEAQRNWTFREVNPETGDDVWVERRLDDAEAEDLWFSTAVDFRLRKDFPELAAAGLGIGHDCTPGPEW